MQGKRKDKYCLIVELSKSCMKIVQKLNINAWKQQDFNQNKI